MVKNIASLTTTGQPFICYQLKKGSLASILSEKTSKRKKKAPKGIVIKGKKKAGIVKRGRKSKKGRKAKKTRKGRKKNAQ
jgi:hypothetical protein